MTIAELIQILFWGWIVVAFVYFIVTELDRETVSDALETAFTVIALIVMVGVGLFLIKLFLVGLAAFGEIRLW